MEGDKSWIAQGPRQACGFASGILITVPVLSTLHVLTQSSGHYLKAILVMIPPITGEEVEAQVY